MTVHDSKIKIKIKSKVTVSQEKLNCSDQLNGILKYFPHDTRWTFLFSDRKLIDLAIKIDGSIGDIIGNHNIYPPSEDIFNAFTYMKSEPKVVLIGQDPYHGRGQAHGLSFSVKRDIRVPPSLKNIYKAMVADDNIDPKFTIPSHGCLTSWTEQGVILLNSSLTVKHGEAGSHVDKWMPFTDRLIELISSNHNNLVFMLWGNKAKSKKKFIKGEHMILEYGHPSPMSRNDFAKNCKHFSQANSYLTSHNKDPIDWSL